jgi:hypothetical protein
MLDLSAIEQLRALRSMDARPGVVSIAARSRSGMRAPLGLVTRMSPVRLVSSRSVNGKRTRTGTARSPRHTSDTTAPASAASMCCWTPRIVRPNRVSAAREGRSSSCGTFRSR